MAQRMTAKSEVVEGELVESTGMFIKGSVLIAISLLLFWALRLLIVGKYPESSAQIVYWKPFCKLAGVLTLLGGIGVIANGAIRLKQVQNRPTITEPCPYCGYGMEFLAAPDKDYDCEGCHRRVYFENGKKVAVHPITCTFCQTVHKVSEKTTSYLCDRCNRALKLTDPNDPTKVVVEQSEMLSNYDVVLTDVGRNRNEVGMALQSILVCNLPDARRQMENLPLTVVRNVPERKADAIRRRLRELGATAVVRQTEQSEQPKAR